MNVNLSGLIQRAKSLNGRDSSFFDKDYSSTDGVVGEYDEKGSYDEWCGCSCHSANYGAYDDFAFNGFDSDYEDYAAEYMGEDDGYYDEDYDDYMSNYDLTDYGFPDDTDVDELVDEIVYLIEELFGGEGVYADASEEVLGNVLGDFDLASYSTDSPSDDYSTIDDGTLSQLESYYQQLKELEKLVGEANGEVSDLTDGEFGINERWNPNGSHDVVRNGNGQDRFDSEKFQEDYRKAHNGEDFQKKYGTISKRDDGSYAFSPKLNFKLEELSAEKQAYVRYAMEQAEENGINPIVFANQLMQESTYNPAARSPKGAENIGQVLPSTAREHGWKPAGTSAANARESIRQAAVLMKERLNKYNGDCVLALADYNGGQRSVDFVKKELGKSNITGKEWIAFMEDRKANYPKSKDRPSLWHNETLSYTKKITGTTA